MSQTGVDLEYILVDGQSTDNTLEIISRYRDRIAKVVSEKDHGLYDAINKGIAMASGEVVALLHSDDFYTHSTVLSDYVTVFEKEGADAVYADLYYVNASNTNTIVRKWISGKYESDSFLYGWMPPHPTFLVKRSVYERFGVFRTDFSSAADYEFMLRVIHKANIRLAYLPEITVKMRVGGKSNQSVSNRVHANLEDRRAWEVNGLRPKWFTLTLKPLRKVTQFLTR